MKTLRDIFLINTDKDANKRLKIKGYNGEYLYLDYDIGHYANANQIGTVDTVPMVISGKYINDTEIKKGDTVVFHHFVAQPNNSIINNGLEVFRCDYFHLWCKVENEKIIPFENYIFVEPIIEKEEDLYAGAVMIKQYKEPKTRSGIVYASSKYSQSIGIKEGDTVHFTKDADYAINILGKTLYRMKTISVVGLQRDGEFMPTLNGVVVRSELGISESEANIGEVIRVGANVDYVNVGDSVSYFTGGCQPVEINDKMYSLITNDNINFVL